ncbi:unnamed protein product [Prunus armeniaca]
MVKIDGIETTGSKVVEMPNYKDQKRGGLDGYVALLTSDQVIDRPSKEPPLGLGSFTSSGSRMPPSHVCNPPEILGSNPWLELGPTRLHLDIQLEF